MEKWEYCWIHHYDKAGTHDDVIGGHFELSMGNIKILFDYNNRQLKEEFIQEKTKEIQQKLPGFDTLKIFFKDQNVYKIDNLLLEMLNYLGNLGWEMTGIRFMVIFFKRPLKA